MHHLLPSPKSICYNLRSLGHGLSNLICIKIHLLTDFYLVSAIDIFVVLSCISVLILFFLVLLRFSFIVHLLQSYYCHITRLR